MNARLASAIAFLSAASLIHAAPLSPSEERASFHLADPSLIVELVAAEPDVISPVAITWDARGRMFVAEMIDYPLGPPAGQIRMMEDRDHDGRYETGVVFADRLPFPNSVLPWNGGLLVTVAPDLVFLKDTDGDGHADERRVLFTGFAEGNQQLRANGLLWGLDNWIYGANGLIGGAIHGIAGGREVNISGRDFRMRPDTGEIEPASGLTQQGRSRDDWDHWFGCDNSTLLWQYPLPEHYVRRNPYIAPPDPRVFVPGDSDPNELFSCKPNPGAVQ